MSSELIGNQPLAGVVSADDFGTLFKNMGTGAVKLIALSFANITPATDEVDVTVTHPSDGVDAVIRQASLDAGSVDMICESRIIEVGEEIRARASVAEAIQWRAVIESV